MIRDMICPFSFPYLSLDDFIKLLVVIFSICLLSVGMMPSLANMIPWVGWWRYSLYSHGFLVIG